MDSNVDSTTPVAGTLPPELVERASIALDRIASGRATRSLIFYGRHGVGKTALLHHICLNAEKTGYLPVMIEAQEACSLALAIPSAMAIALREPHSGLSQEMIGKGVEFHVDGEGVPRLTDSGDLEMDMTDLFQVVGAAAAEQSRVVVLLIDGIQNVPIVQLAALTGALHSTNQKQYPIILVAAGLPQILGQMGQAKSYAERLYEFVPIGQQGRGGLDVQQEAITTA